MSGQFRFTLDDFYELSDDPIGWEDAKIVIERKDEFSGVFINYVAELTFWGDGFAYIKSQIVNRGYCFSVKIKIEYRCDDGSYDGVFDGYINIQYTEKDNERCQISSNIETNDVYTLFLDKVDTEFDLLNDTTKLPDGTDLAPVTTDITYHNVLTADNVTDFWHDNRAKAIKAIDAIDFFCKYYTGGRMSAQSDFFNTEPLTDKWRVELTGSSLLLGQTLTMTYRNYFGMVLTATATFMPGGSEISALIQLANDAMQKIQPGFDQIPTVQAVQAFDATVFSHHTFDISDRYVILEAWIPIEILSVVVTGIGAYPDVTITKEQAWRAGGKDLYLSDQTQERVQALSVDFIQTRSETSFKELFSELDKIYGLGMQVIPGVGGFILKVEPLSYFYDNFSSLEIDDIYDSSTSYDVDQNYNSIKIDNESQASRQTYTIANITMSGSAGSNMVTFAGFLDQIKDKDYLRVSSTPPLGTTVTEIVHIKNVATGELYQPLIFNHVTGGQFVWIVEFANISPTLPGVNAKNTSIPVECLGTELDLSSKYIVDIDRHGDQVFYSESVNNSLEYYQNYSAGSGSKMTLIQCTGTEATIYPYYFHIMLGMQVERFGFNAPLINHCKVINNQSRYRNNVSFTATKFTQFEGEVLEYVVTEESAPFSIIKYKGFLSYSQVRTLLMAPQSQIDSIINDIRIPTWIKKLTFTINSKETDFELYTRN